MAFIDSTYFYGEIAIPNASSNTALSTAITQYEKEILMKLLGYPLYKALQADLVAGVPQTQKYIDLVDGKEFTHVFDGTSYTLKWEGLKNSSKVSLIAYYVYYKFIERDITRLYDGSGISTPKAGEAWDRVSPVNKMCASWERMRELYGKIEPEYKLLYPYPTPAADIDDVYNVEPSAFNFLYANRDTYTDWIFTPLWSVNAFGI